MSTPQNKKPLQQIKIGDFIIDATISEDHDFDSDVTQYPVETGSAITDNIRPQPIVVTLEGVVSDTPIGKIADLRNAEGDNGQMDFLPSDDALAALLAIRDARQPVPIVSSLQAFDNMVMTNLSIPRDAKTGAALRFSATFQQVIFVTNKRTTVRVSSPSGAAKIDKGNQQPVAKKLIHAKVDPYGGEWFDETAPNPSLGAGAKGRWRYGAQPPAATGGTWKFVQGPFVKTDAQEATDNAGLVSVNPKTRAPIVNPGQTFQLVTGDMKAP